MNIILIIAIAVIVVIPVAAELIRPAIEANIELGSSVTVIPNVLDLTNSRNKGVAFGMFQDGTVFFAVATSVVIVVFFILLIKNYKNSKLFSIASALIIGGGLANLFERVVYGYVVD